MLIESPSFLEFFTSCNSSNVFILLPSALTIKSPLLNPAMLAGVLPCTSIIYIRASGKKYLREKPLMILKNAKTAVFG